MARFTSGAIVALVVFASLSVPVSAATVTVTVSVVDQNHTPVSGAELTVSWDGGSAQATTAGNGKAFVDVPEGADLTVEVEHPDYVRNRAFKLSDASEGDVTVPVYRKGSISFVVADDSGAVADARILVRQDGRIVSSGRTDSSGRFQTAGLEWGAYTVAVVKAGYYRETSEVDVDGATGHSVHLESGTIIYTFNVTDPHFRPPQPVANASIELEGVGTVTTQGDGRATVGVPVNSAFELTASKDGYESVTRSVSGGERDRTLNVSMSRSPQITLSSANQRVLVDERVVVEAIDQYGTPVEGATIFLDEEAVGTTDADGELAVRLEEPGDHVLRARASGVESNPVSVEGVVAGGSTPTPTASPSATPSDTPSAISAPGFTAPIALLALLLSALASSHLRRRH